MFTRPPARELRGGIRRVYPPPLVARLSQDVLTPNTVRAGDVYLIANGYATFVACPPCSGAVAPLPRRRPQPLSQPVAEPVEGQVFPSAHATSVVIEVWTLG